VERRNWEEMLSSELKELEEDEFILQEATCCCGKPQNVDKFGKRMKEMKKLLRKK